MKLSRILKPLLYTNKAKIKMIPPFTHPSESKKFSVENKASSQQEYLELKDEILKTTKFVNSEMVPEFGLHIITPDMEVWNQPYDQLSEDFRCSFWHSSMPYWAIFWPGGQILSRYLLDFPNVVRNKRVIDIGSGSGGASLASIISGCETVTANDIDDMSLSATLLNAQTNNLLDSGKLRVSNDNFLEGNVEDNARYLASHADVLLVGDMYFDEEIGDKLSVLLSKYRKSDTNSEIKNQKKILIGDPGRWYLRDKNKKKDRLKCIAKYELSDDIKRHNYGLVQGVIYEDS